MIASRDKSEKRGFGKVLLRFGVWLVTITSVIFILFLGAMIAVGGQNEAVKAGLESYLSQASQMEASIGRFDNARFFPDIEFDLGDVTFRKEGADSPALRIENVLFSMSFFDMIFMRQHLRLLDVENIYAGPGVFSDQSLQVDVLKLDRQGWQGKPALIVKGRHGANEFAAHLPVLYSTKSKYFERTEGRDGFELTTTRLKAGGFYASGKEYKKIHFNNIGVPEKILAGDVIFSGNAQNFTLKADLKAEKTTFDLDLVQEAGVLRGTITAPILDLSDTGHLRSLYDEYNNFMGISPSKDTQFSPKQNIKVTLKAQKVVFKEQDLGHLSAPLSLQNSVLIVGPLEGDISGGKLEGNIKIDGTTALLDMTAQVVLKELRHDYLQKAFTGSALAEGTVDMSVDLTSKAPSGGALLANLNGRSLLVAGPAKFDSALMNLWGTGLINSLVPDVSGHQSTVNLNCAVADFKIRKGIAKADPLFVDSERMTITGSGQVNLPKQTVSIRLSPQSKDPALLSVSPAVNVSGSLAKPSIAPDALSTGMALGRLVFSAINPAYLALSLTDLGLTSSHPCYNFIANQPEPAAGQPTPMENIDPEAGGTVITDPAMLEEEAEPVKQERSPYNN